MISHEIFANVMGLFEVKLGPTKALDDFAYRAYYAALRDEFADDDAFYRAGLHVFGKHAWNTWPAPIEFISAAATLRRIPDAEITATLAAIDQSRALISAHTSAHEHVVDAFGAEWRRVLAHCKPRTLQQLVVSDSTDPWLTDERRALPDPTADREVA